MNQVRATLQKQLNLLDTRLVEYHGSKLESRDIRKLDDLVLFNCSYIRYRWDSEAQFLAITQNLNEIDCF